MQGSSPPSACGLGTPFTDHAYGVVPGSVAVGLEVLMWHVYIAQCEDQSLYTGVTTDLEQRLRRHHTGRGSAYVRSKGLAAFIYVESYATQSEALKRELEIKSWGRHKKFQLIQQSRSHG